MFTFIRWVCRLGALSILAGVAIALPFAMAPMRYWLQVVTFAAMVAAVCASLLALLVSLIPAPKGAQPFAVARRPAQPQPRPQP